MIFHGNGSTACAFFLWVAAAIVALLFVSPAFGANGADFVNFESPHVSPLALSPDGTRLALVNTPDAHVWFYDVTGLVPVFTHAVPVGIDPVSVRWRNDGEVWVVNRISDSVSVVDVDAAVATATINTRDTSNLTFPPPGPPGDFGDEPADVVFAGSPVMAYISCEQSNTVLVVNPADPEANAIDYITIMGERPRQLAVSADGMRVYAAIFESGNGTTLIAGGADGTSIIDFPPNVVNDINTPYGGVNPPPNDGAAFNPPLNMAAGTPPRVGLIVRQAGAQWLDDNGVDWSAFVDGANAAQSGRYPGWTLIDNDIAIINTMDHSVTYADSLMNIVMALNVHPVTGQITAVGTEALNEVRFEPVVNGVFLRVRVAAAHGVNGATDYIEDLNKDHLDYTVRQVPVSERLKSIGDPRGIAWSQDGNRAYVTGMGSNNVVVIDANGERAGLAPTIPVEEGPTGLALDDAANRLYVLNRFAASISVIDTQTEQVVATVPFFDPTPEVIKTGRKHLYDTHKNSGLGHVACASCHVDARMDRLAWDLGEPDGHVITLSTSIHNLGAGIPGLQSGFQNFHPMKGPMTTQTLQDIIGKEPFHWRGDRLGLEEFNPAFMGLQSNTTMLTSTEMQEFKDFLATVHFPPNPFRNLDNSLPENLPLPGHLATGRFALNDGDPLPNGNARTGLDLYRGEPNRSRRLDSNVFTCVDCHSLPLGNGGHTVFNGDIFNPHFAPIPPGPNGENQVQLVSVDGSTNKAIKTPHLRNGYQKVGFSMHAGAQSLSGFGLLHDGSIDSLSRFVSEITFTTANDQEVADLVALLLSFSGGFGDDLLVAMGKAPRHNFEFPPQVSLDAHAATGHQVALDSANQAEIDDLVTLAQGGKIDLIIRGIYQGVQRGFVWTSGTLFQADSANQQVLLATLLAAKEPNELTLTAVPLGSGIRLGIDRDGDGYFDYDEILAGSDPADPKSIPSTAMPASTPGLLLAAALVLAMSPLLALRRRKYA